MAAIWPGIHAGKTHHHCVAIEESGHRLLSRRVANDEPELLTDILALGDETTWGVDLADGGAALAVAILLNHDQPVHYISGRAIHRASESCRGEGRTDAKDAAVIALKILTGRPMGLVADHTRTINRLRAQLTGIFTGLELALAVTDTGPLTRSSATPARSAATCDGDSRAPVDSSACSASPRCSASAGSTNRAGSRNQWDQSSVVQIPTGWSLGGSHSRGCDSR
ncbi:IS110 family transposase [Streptomyces vinaceus]|uniref:IS110 family transposase n=1 Tax=Streptomyces vinaceus TaxID=1960 RepID=UPI003815F24A